MYQEHFSLVDCLLEWNHPKNSSKSYKSCNIAVVILFSSEYVVMVFPLPSAPGTNRVRLLIDNLKAPTATDNSADGVHHGPSMYNLFQVNDSLS